MKENLALLVQLQSVDSQLLEIEELKGDLPAQVEQFNKALELLDKAIEGKQTRLEEIGHEQRHIQGTLAVTREQLKKYQEQLLAVSTNRAYDALMAEIDGTKKSVEEGDYRLLELGEEQERLADELKSDKLTAEDKREKLDSQQKSLGRTIAETEAQAKVLEGERIRIREQVDPRFYKSYERIRAARDGRAVVQMSRGSCGACYNSITAQRQVEIKAMNKIITCDSCGVILYWQNT